MKPITKAMTSVKLEELDNLEWELDLLCADYLRHALSNKRDVIISRMDTLIQKYNQLKADVDAESV